MRRVYDARLAEMSPGERVRIGVQLWEAANALQRAALLREDPSLSESEILYRMAVSRFGEKLATTAYRR